MDWRILMCATRSCLRAKLNNLGKCVVTTAQHTPISVFVCLPALCYIHPQFWSKCLSNMARSFSSDRCWLMQFSTHWQNFIFLWSSQNCNPGFINYTYSHQSSFIYWSFAWVKQGKHNVKPFLITEGACLCVCTCVCRICVCERCTAFSACISLARTCPTVLLWHEWLSYRGPNWTCIFITAFIIVFIKSRV